jgi:hypothetical protein
MRTRTWCGSSEKTKAHEGLTPHNQRNFVTERRKLRGYDGYGGVGSKRGRCYTVLYANGLRIRHAAMARIEKTVFISYRRADEPWALAVFENLTQHGYDVFIDYDGIASGNFATVILENIRARAHFLVLLTPTALERCRDPEDWMRREIEAALDSQRNIVPLMLAGFDFGTPATASQLTGKLTALKEYNGLEIPKGYFSPAMERLRNKFLSVSLDMVLHPASLSAQQAATDQKDKATLALGNEQRKPADRGPSQLPETQIARLDRIAQMVPKIFLSYVAEDRWWVERFVNVFAEHVGEVKIQEDFKIFGDKFVFGEIQRWVDQSLSKATAVIVFVSEFYIQKEWALAEWKKTVNEYRRRRLVFVPIILDADAKSWWDHLRTQADLCELPVDHIYFSYVNPIGGRVTIRGDDEVQARISKLALAVRSFLLAETTLEFVVKTIDF